MAAAQLTPVDWIQAAFRALTKGGPKSVNVEAIARALKVSKGSFYWHFANAGALKTAMITHWEDHATQMVIANLDATPSSAADRLRQLVHIITHYDSAAYGGRQAESAIRDWARYDSEVAAGVDRVERQRITYTARLFAEAGDPPEKAQLNARLLYAGLIGTDQLSFREICDPQTDLVALLELLLAGKDR